jgi:hypothetical protein
MVREAGGPSFVYAVGNDEYVADLVAYVTFPPTHLLGALTSRIHRHLTGNPWEATVYLGVIDLAVLAWLYARAEARNRALLTYVLCGIAVFAVVASGDTLHVLGFRTIPLPDALLSGLPLFRNVRAPSRAIVFVYLFLSIGVGLAASLAIRHWSRPLVRWGAVAVAALIVLDFFPRHLTMAPVSCPPGLEVIRDDPEHDFGVLNMPGGYTANDAFMLQQLCHGRPIVQGQTARDVARTLRDRLEVNDLQAQRRQLTEAKVKYVVISGDAPPVFQWSDHYASRDEYSRTYRVVSRTPDFTILRVY